MGTCYYLRRPDNLTLFDLGKSWRWGKFLGDGSPVVVTDPTDLIGPIRIDLDIDDPDPGPHTSDYAIYVATKIVRWADGQPFEFVPEDGFDDWECRHPNWDKLKSVTGTRFNYHP